MWRLKRDGGGQNQGKKAVGDGPKGDRKGDKKGGKKGSV